MAFYLLPYQKNWWHKWTQMFPSLISKRSTYRNLLCQKVDWSFYLLEFLWCSADGIILEWMKSPVAYFHFSLSSVYINLVPRMVVLSVFNMEVILFRILTWICSTYSGTGGGDRNIIVGIEIRQKSQRKTTQKTTKKNLYRADQTAFSVPSSVKHHLYLYIYIFYRLLHRSPEFAHSPHIQVF